MAVVLTLHNPTDLDAAVDLVHDRWFTTKDIVFDEPHAALLIRFASKASGERLTAGRRWFSKERKPILVEWILKIGNVERYWIEDKAGIEKYDFNNLVYDQRAQTVTITSGFPFRIVVAVKDLAITVEETANILT